MERRVTMLFAATLLLPMLLAAPFAPQFRAAAGPQLLAAAQTYLVITVPIAACAGYLASRDWTARALFFGISLLVSNLVGFRLFRALLLWAQG